MMKNVTENYYREKAGHLVKYIHDHLDQNLTVKQLASQFNISVFHFHRIMQVFMGENLGSYINGIRIGKALNLIRNTALPLTDIAYQVGFSDVSSLTKTFSKRFGISPSMYRDDSSLILNTHFDFRESNTSEIIKEIYPKVVYVPQKKVFYIEIFGPYQSSLADKSWDELADFALTNKLIRWRHDAFTLYYDSPETTEEIKCRSDLCIASEADAVCMGRISHKFIEGGKYLYFRYRGRYNLLNNVYSAILLWLPFSQYSVRKAPVMEKYVNNDRITAGHKLITELFIPVY